MSRRESAGVDKFREFHRKEPRKIGEFHRDFEIPEYMRLLGVAKFVLYRSDKVDPETLEQPRHPLNYIHEHDAGVKVYVPTDSRIAKRFGYDTTLKIPPQGPHGGGYFNAIKQRLFQTGFDDASICSGGSQDIEVELVRLGLCLGFGFEDDDGEHEAQATSPLPELYCSTTGRTLLVVQSKRELVALIHGGALGVEARGIVG